MNFMLVELEGMLEGGKEEQQDQCNSSEEIRQIRNAGTKLKQVFMCEL